MFARFYVDIPTPFAREALEVGATPLFVMLFVMFHTVRYLHRTIQESRNGHNSKEDAVAALELAQLKVSKGPNFGAERSMDCVFDRLGR